VRLHPQDKEKTAFSTTQGLFHFTVAPFGLANSPSTFERLMEDVLRGQWEECLLYVTSTTGEDHWLFDGSMTPLLNILSISVFSISLFPNGSRL
jgi:hypothetical protein